MPTIILATQVGQRTLKHQKEANAVLGFDTRDAHAPEDASRAETVHIEFGQDELFSFFQKIERVQEQLDLLDTAAVASRERAAAETDCHGAANAA